MIRHQDVIQDRKGNAIVGASVTVYAGGTVEVGVTPDPADLADIYSDDGVTPITGSVVTSDDDGEFWFFVAAGAYDFVTSMAGYTDVITSSVSIGTIIPAAPTAPIWTDEAGDAFSTPSNLQFGKAIITKALIEKVVTLTDAATVDIDASLGSVYLLTAAGDRTLTVSNAVVGTNFTLVVTNDGTARQLTFSTGFTTLNWLGDAQPTETVGTDVYSLFAITASSWIGTFPGSHA